VSYLSSYRVWKNILQAFLCELDDTPADILLDVAVSDSHEVFP
jgi:hypothetical protein